MIAKNVTMDLTTAVNSMASNPPPPIEGAVACPVCTLYLREGISLQKHLDTHPKEQVIEALIRASNTGNVSPVLGQQQPPSTCSTPHPPQTPTPGIPIQSAPTPVSPSPHIHPHAPPPYPIGPIFECPPMNAMVPPQYASFSYQQFVNNGKLIKNCNFSELFQSCI